LDFCLVAAVMQQLDFVITVDTGILHVAVALRVPTLGLFGKTSPSRFVGLYPDLWYCLRKEPIALSNGYTCRWSCEGDYRKGYDRRVCPSGCDRMKALTTDEILAVFHEAWQDVARPEYVKRRLLENAM
jgi:hypothetical protein